tara:strand:+ start:431 stop:658 length:228 start_codon:yes stop_codon:yes gene_type:complete
MDKELFILKTTQLHSTNGVVHLQVLGYDADGFTDIEWDARSLLEDIPSLYAMAKQAIKQEDKYTKKKYKEFKELL